MIPIFSILIKPKENPNILRSFHIFRVLLSHYDTLKLKPNCTLKEIKESFIKLSKENHPDVNKSKEAHERFVKITQAYEVLSKAESRRYYDLGQPNNNKHKYYSQGQYSDPTFYHNRRAHEPFDDNNDAYYGIKGIKKVSNGTIAMLCFFIAFFGLILQALAIKYSFTLQRNQLIKQSDEAEELLKEARARAKANGNQMQLELFKLKHEMAQAAKKKAKDL